MNIAEKLSFSKWRNSAYYRPLADCLFSTPDPAIFLDKVLEKIQLPAKSKIIEAGCGAGLNARILAAAGYDVTGVDFPPAEIEQALQQENDQLHFFQHDLRLPFWMNYFDAAFSLFNSFGYYNTLREHDSAARTISQSLKLGGVLVMDYMNAHYAEDNLIETEDLDIDGLDYLITNTQTEDSILKHVEVSRDNEVVDQFTIMFNKFSPGDFTDMFAYQGMQIQEVFGDYELGNYDIRKSPRLIFIAKKIRL